MIKAEWQFLAKHKFILIVLCVIVLIPSIYAVFFLKSLWNPYGELQDLPVAIVDQDHPTKYQGHALNLGQNLTHNLEHSKALGFHKVANTATAQRGLNQGKYYMVLTIPKDFSKNATTLMATHPKKMILHYKTSAGHSFFAGKATTSAAENIRTTVAQEVTQTYAKTIFNTIQKLDQGFLTANQDNQKLADGSTQVQRANQQITTNLNTLAHSTLILQSGSQQLDQGLHQYLYSVQELQNGSRQLQNGLTQLVNETPALVGGLTQLATGTNQVVQKTSAYVQGAQQLKTGVTALNDHTATFTSGLQQLGQSTSSLATGIQPLNTSAQTLTQNLQNLSGQSTQLVTRLQQLGQTFNNSTASAAKISDQIAAAHHTLSQLAPSNQDLTQIQTNLTQLKNAVAQPQNNTTLTQKVAAVADTQNLTATQKQAILSAVQDTSTTSTNTDATQQALSALTASVNNLSKDLPDNQAAVDLPTTPTPDLTPLAQMSQTLAQGLQQATTGSGNLAIGLNEFTQNLPVLASNAHQLATGASTLSQSTTQSVADTQTLAGQGSALVSGTQNPNQGATQLAGQAPTLTSGEQQLVQGSQRLNQGFTQLTANNATLQNGSDALALGAGHFGAGTTELAAGSQLLAPALAQIHTGNQTLATALAHTAKKAKVTPSQLTYNQMAKPVTTAHDEEDQVPNNGTGMAPYMLCVSLFVGALALNMMFDLYTPRRYPDGPLGWWASKASVWLSFVLCASLLMGSLVILVDGLSPVRTAVTLGLLILIGATFMSIVVWLNLVLGKAGSFFSMVLLVLQLSSSAGTYPIQLSNGFFETLHPWLPMTYGVDGLRQALMIGGSVWPDVRILLLFFVVFTFLTLVFFARRGARMKLIDFNDPLAVQATQNRLSARMAHKS